ncbi:MAG: lysophospholipid acyltransferase family protein [Verrucomicrobiota bacterium]
MPPLTLGEVLGRPYPHLADSGLTRFLTRGTLVAFRQRILEVQGLEHVRPENDPFILVLNHSQKLEAVLAPAIFFHYRDGKRIHFIADWNFCLIPGVYLFYRAGQTITLVRKPARPRFLNVFKPLFTDGVPAYERARQRLDAGASVGIFPEGTTNRDSSRLLRGFNGAAKLSLESGVKVVPVGLTFPGVPPGEKVSEFAPMRVNIGPPMQPEKLNGAPSAEAVNDWHACVMRAIGRLSGKEWQANTSRR